MTLIDATDGEVIVLDAAGAERRAERITDRLDAIADNYRAVLPMIREAVEKRDDIALGYPSPGAYVADRFGQSLAGLGIDVRRAVVAELTEAGMSTRAIAPVVGVSHVTVIQDRKEMPGGKPLPPEPIGEPDPSGSYTSAESELGQDEPHAQEAPGPAPVPLPPITGIDGKSYRRAQKPATPESITADEVEHIAGVAANANPQLVDGPAARKALTVILNARKTLQELDPAQVARGMKGEKHPTDLDEEHVDVVVGWLTELQRNLRPTFHLVKGQQ